MEQSDEKLNFTRQEIEQHLQSALAAATPNVWEKLDLSVPQDKPQELSKVLRLEQRLRRAGCAAACICLLAGGGIYHYEYMQVASVVGIDVNPSLRISLNRREKVLKAEALNPDGEIVLDKELQGESLESALGQVVDSLVEKGYLKEGQKEQAVLVSVSGKNKKKAEKVKTAAAANMEESMAQKQVSAVVYDQTIQVTKELEELAESYQVSVGKASFIEQLVQENESLSQDVQASYAWMMNQPMESITQEISENEYSVSAQVNVIQVEPSVGASTSNRDKPSRADMDTEPVREDEETQKERENMSGSGQGEDPGLTKEEDGLKAGEAGAAKEQTGDEDKESREKSKKPAGQKENETEAAKKGKQDKESREAEDKDKENPKDRVSKGQDAKEEEQKNKGEATSSTVGAENPDKETAETEIAKKETAETKTAETETVETVESTDAAEDELKNMPEDKAEGEKRHPEETIEDETSRIPLVEYSQPVKDEEEQEDLVVGNDLLNRDSQNQVDGVIENIRSEAGSGDVKASENSENIESPENEEKQQETAESPEAEEKQQETVENPEAGKNEQETAENPEAGKNEQETAKSPEVGEKQQETVKSLETGGNAQEIVENQKTDEREGREVFEETGSQEINGQESTEKPEETAKAQESTAEPEETQENKAGEEQQKEGNLTATQIIRVKVEKKEWKEPEKPVFASQFLGFSHRRLLSRGPGAFDFIVVNPEELLAKKEHSQKASDEEADEDQEWDEDAETDDDDKERFLEAEEEETFGEAAEEWEAEMGEWLHFGPGYLNWKE